MNPQIKLCVEAVRKVTDFVPRVALTLGSGLGGFADRIHKIAEIPYSELPGFPVSTVAGHKGTLIFGYLDSVPVVCMNGRVHLYEGYSTEQVTMPVKLMYALGAEILFLTNASGGIKGTYHPGTLSLITDHISCFIPNPLIGPNDDTEGLRFPDMTAVYDRELCSIVRKAAQGKNIPLDEGVYLQLTGPSFETPAEIRMAKTIGADMVGMSTVVEAITARHIGLRVVGVSLISNLAAGISDRPLTHEEVAEAGREAGPRFTALVEESIRHM